MAKKPSKTNPSKHKVYSGRSGASALSNATTKRNQYKLNGPNAAVGEKNTVRSGAKSSSTYYEGSKSVTGGKAYVGNSRKKKKD